MKLKQLLNIFHVIVNANSIVQIAIQIKNGTKKTKLANVDVKIIIRAKKIIIRILAHVFMRKEST